MKAVLHSVKTQHQSAKSALAIKLVVLLQAFTKSKRQLQQQLRNTRAALITSRSTANSAGTFAAQVVADKQRHKAALREMRAYVDEMYMEGELAFECILNEKEKLTKDLEQEKASRVQEAQTLMEQMRSLTAQLTFSQVRPNHVYSIGFCHNVGWQACTAICKHCS